MCNLEKLWKKKVKQLSFKNGQNNINRIKFESDRFAIKHIIIPLSLALVLIYVPMYKMPS